MTSAAPDNRRAIIAMVIAMAAFTLTDTMIKAVSTSLPLGEMIVIRNIFATLLAFGVALIMGGLSRPRGARMDLISWRLVGEVGSTLTFLTALTAMPMADAIAIAQFTPIAVTAGAAVFLSEQVGWRRWLAALVGFVGVLLIIKPGAGAFSAPGLLALAAVGFIVLRDLTTRGIAAASVSTLTLAMMSSISVGLSGFLLWPYETWLMPGALDVAGLGLAAAGLMAGYVFITIAMRTGDIAAASPFRYIGMPFAILAGYIGWGDLPDGYSWAGIALIAAAGLYTLHRQRLRRV